MKNKKIITLLTLLLISTASSTYASNWLDSIKKSSIYTAIAKRPLLSLTAICLCGALIAKGSSLFEKSKAIIMRTHAGFYISRYYNKIMYGSDFTFDQMAGDPIDQNTSKAGNNNIFIKFDKSGKIIQAINDGKKTPLALGSIPDNQNHIDELIMKFNNNSNQIESAAIFTLNEDWECNAAGLSKLVKNNKKLPQFNYTTKDFDAPLLVDLIRSVRDLENRDNYNKKVCLVHCKAGRGRSATVVGAYIAHVIQKAGQFATPKQIEEYLVARRPQVKLTSRQNKVLREFNDELKKEGSFEALCYKHTDAVEKRDKEIEKLKNESANSNSSLVTRSFNHMKSWVAGFF